MKLSRLLKGLLLLVCIGVISTVYAQERKCYRQLFGSMLIVLKAG